MMFAISCENELDLGTNVGENAQVTFSVGTPEIATRAYSDGLTATHLQYAVYDANGNELTDLTVTDATINGSTTVNLQLTTGNTYSVIFWAAAPNAPYTVDFANKTMTVNYATAVSNDEKRDAFYKYHTFTVKGAQTETIELRRPFAQLNIGTADYAASTSAGYTPIRSAVTVKNIYSTLNLATGAVDGSAVAEFDFADIEKNEIFPVAGYEYMAMNYLLVAADKEVVDVVFTYTDANNNAKERTVGSVPVQRNYRTNIYGNLLTSDVDINVVIVPEYEEPAFDNEHGYYFDGTSYFINAPEGIVWMANEVNKVGPQAANIFDNKTVFLTRDIDMGGIEVTPIGDYASSRTMFRGTFDGQGYTISNFKVTKATTRTEKVADCPYGLFGNVNGTIKNLTIDNATVAPANNGKFAGVLAGRLNKGAVIDNCHVTNSTVTITNWQAGGLVGQVSECVIKNSSVSKSTITGMSAVGAIVGMVMGEGEYTFDNCEVKECAIVQNDTFGAAYDLSFGVAVGVVNHSNSTLYINELTAEDNTVKGVASSLLVGEIKSGAKVIIDGLDSSVASTQAMLDSALKQDARVYLASGEYTINGNFPAGATIIGAGENVVLNIEVKIYTVNGTATIENVKVVFSNNGYKGFQGGVDLNFKECTIEGQPFLYGTKATFEGCTFVQNDAEQYNVWTYAVREANFIDCVFNCAGKSVLVYSEAGDLVQNVNFEGCTFNASAPYNGKAAIEIGAAQLTTGMYNVNINDTEVNNFANGSVSGNPVWNVKNGNRANVVVDGEICTVGGAEKVSNGLWKSGSTYSVTNAEGLASINSKLSAMSAGRDVAIEILADIDFTGKTWTPVKSHIDWNNTVNSINGNGHTIKNLTINGQAMFTVFANTHDVVVKDITFDNATVTCNGLNTAIIVGQTYNNLLLDNVDVKNSAITGTYKVAALVGTVYDEKATTVTATLKNCDVAKTSVTSTQYDFCTAGMVSFVYADNNDKIEFENCTVSDVKLYGPTTYGYKAHAAIYTTGSESLFNEAEGVTVTNVTFENI